MWHIHYGKGWLVQWCFDWWFSLGIHIDLKRRIANHTDIAFGPYVDFHLGFVIVSLGYNPVLSGTLATKTSVSRGGIDENYIHQVDQKRLFR